MKNIYENVLRKQDIKNLIIHCSDTEDNKKMNAVDIHLMHLNFGWDGVGYHKIILRSGKVENGRPEYWVGAHVRGKNNNSLGVCLIGREKFTKKQFLSLRRILKRWKIKYPDAEIIGHSDAGNTNKTCPNFDVKMWLKETNI